MLDNNSLPGIKKNSQFHISLVGPQAHSSTLCIIVGAAGFVFHPGSMLYSDTEEMNYNTSKTYFLIIFIHFGLSNDEQ